jgi:hypothetical protein
VGTQSLEAAYLVEYLMTDALLDCQQQVAVNLAA